MAAMFVWVRKEAYDVIVIGRVVLAELHLYWSSCSVLAELLCTGQVCHSYELDRFCHINTVLLIVN